MVSTRGRKSRHFEKGEKVLCYEPDLTKAKVLYDSKILGIYESKDKRGRKVIQYKIHFQGWSSSWDRKVSADFVLRDTENNRQLQRELAEKAQLQLGSYLYRKDRSVSKKKRLRTALAFITLDESSGSTVTSPIIRNNFGHSPSPQRPRESSEDNYSSGSIFEKHEDISMKDEFETESCCSSIESFHDEDRVMMRVSERLRYYLEYDHDMVIKFDKKHLLPARVPVVAILENFVKHSAVKLIYSTTQSENTRRRTTQQRGADKKERELDKIIATVSLLKEVVDGLRIYFDFTLSDYLLYKEEKHYALTYLSANYLKTFTYIAMPGLATDLTANLRNENGLKTTTTATTTATSEHLDVPMSEESQKRKLRSYRSDDCDITLENCLSSIASTSSRASTPSHHNVSGVNINYIKPSQPLPLNGSPQLRDFLQNILSWNLLPPNATPAPSMIFGAPHLARLLVKLPEFLNASSMNDEKLKILLQHLDTFVNYLESRKEWFNEENYVNCSNNHNLDNGQQHKQQKELDNTEIIRNRTSTSTYGTASTTTVRAPASSTTSTAPGSSGSTSNKTKGI